MQNNNWREQLKDFKMENGTTSEYAALLLGGYVEDEKKAEMLEILYMIGDYELEFLSSYSMHLIDMLETMMNRESGDNLEIELEDIVGYTLQHMGIDGLR